MINFISFLAGLLGLVQFEVVFMNIIPKNFFSRNFYGFTFIKIPILLNSGFQDIEHQIQHILYCIRKEKRKYKRKSFLLLYLKNNINF